MRTMSNLGLMKYAYDGLLERWHRETKFNEAFNREHGIYAPITSRRIDTYDKQIEELRELIIQEEKLLSIE